MTDKQKIIIKVALALFLAISAVIIHLVTDVLRQLVTIIREDGSTYTKHIKNVNGQAKIIFNGFQASQARAEGMFHNGKLNGPGCIKFQTGAIDQEEGEFIEGWLVKGTITYRNNMTETGTFSKGRLHGEGKRTHPDDSLEEGLFYNGNLMQFYTPIKR